MAAGDQIESSNFSRFELNWQLSPSRWQFNAN
jgi:hypothetical protein